MKHGMKKALSAAIALMTTATLAITAYAMNYDINPSFPSANSESVSVSTETIKDAVDKAVSDEGGAVASVEVKSTVSLPVSSSVMKSLSQSEDEILEIVSPKATISIDSSTITKVRKVDLSSKIYSSKSRAVVRFRSKANFGCEVKITLTNCKMTEAALAKAHVYCDGEDLGPVELDENGNPVITVTKGGKYEIK